MNAKNAKRLDRLDYLKSLKNDVELAGLPSKPESRRLTFAVILGDFYRYLELGGTGGYVEIQSFTPTCEKWVRLIEKFSHYIGFPKHLIEPLQVAVAWGDVREIARLVGLAAKALQDGVELA